MTEKVTLDQLNDAINTATKECKNPYAQSYLNAIPYAMAEASDFGKTPLEGLRVQLLYCLNNMTAWRGESAREVKKIMNQWIKENKNVN